MNETFDFNQIMKDKDQILIAAWMLPNEGALTDEMRRQAIRNFVEYRARHGVTVAAVANQLGKPSASVISEIISGKYRGNVDTHLRAINMWVEQHARQNMVSVEQPFVRTQIATVMLNIARLVREDKTMGIVFGPAGIGKSRCCQAIHKTTIGSIYIQIMLSYHTPKGLIRLLAKKLGNVTSRTTSDNVTETRLEGVLARLTGSRRLLIIDEAHQLSNQALQLLRSIHDVTGVPILLVAIKDLYERIARDADPDHGQLKSRFDVVFNLAQGLDIHKGGKNRPLFSVADIVKLYAQTPIRLSKDAGDFLCAIANLLGHGSLRTCEKLVAKAARRARKRQNVDPGDPVTITAADLAYAEKVMRPEAMECEIARHRRAITASAQSA